MLLLVAGCQKAITFPEHSMASVAKALGAAGAYDTNRDGLADFYTFADESGRISRIAYDDGKTGRPSVVVDLDAIPFDRCRHLAIILDGFGYEVVKEYYDSGGLRWFHAPSRVISPYPAMTDTAIEDLLGYMPCPANEAMYYDRTKNQTVGGSAAYLAGKNMPYNDLLQYRAGLIEDALGYLWPRGIYRGELDGLKKTFDRRKTQEVLAYIVSSAGIGTKFGKAGQLEALRQLDQLLNQIMWETRGLVKLTLLADHGHSYTPATRIPLEKALESKGWRIADRLKDPNDVVYIRFGLETYAAFYTNSPARLAKDLAWVDGVDLVSYADGGDVVVLKADRPIRSWSVLRRCVVRQSGGRFQCGHNEGDPLAIRDALANLHADANGYFDANDLLAATVDGEYPAPLERLWRAHYGLVEHPPDVIVSLEDRFYSGSTGFGGAVNVASTHGGLNKRNCTAFIMSSVGDLPPFMRSRDVPANMTDLIRRKWPQGR